MLILLEIIGRTIVEDIYQPQGVIILGLASACSIIGILFALIPRDLGCVIPGGHHSCRKAMMGSTSAARAAG